MSKHDTLEIWCKPERMMNVEVEKGLYSAANIGNWLGHADSFVIRAVDGRQLFFRTSNVFFIILHPASE